MKKFNFTWDYEVEAETFKDAVDQLLGTIQDPENTATCYTVAVDGEPLKGFIDAEHADTDTDEMVSSHLQEEVKRRKL